MEDARNSRRVLNEGQLRTLTLDQLLEMQENITNIIKVCMYVCMCPSYLSYLHADRRTDRWMDGHTYIEQTHGWTYIHTYIPTYRRKGPRRMNALSVKIESRRWPVYHVVIASALR